MALSGGFPGQGLSLTSPAPSSATCTSTATRSSAAPSSASRHNTRHSFQPGRGDTDRHLPALPLQAPPPGRGCPARPARSQAHPRRAPSTATRIPATARNSAAPGSANRHNSARPSSPTLIARQLPAHRPTARLNMVRQTIAQAATAGAGTPGTRHSRPQLQATAPRRREVATHLGSPGHEATAPATTTVAPPRYSRPLGSPGRHQQHRHSSTEELRIRT